MYLYGFASYVVICIMEVVIVTSSVINWW